MGKLEGKVAVVTGAGSGMGRQTAKAFIAEGAKVVLVDRDEATVRAASEEYGADALAITADVAYLAAMQQVVREAIATYSCVDIIFNNAGFGGPHAPMHEQDEELFDAQIAVNLKGVWNGMQAVLPHFLERESGTIINTASAAGLVGWKGLAAYSAAKHAVVGLTKSASLDYADRGIRINAIAPGMIYTGLSGNDPSGSKSSPYSDLPFPMKRMGEASEIASAAVFLASNDSSFITGVSLPVDGGYTVP